MNLEVFRKLRSNEAVHVTTWEKGTRLRVTLHTGLVELSEDVWASPNADEAVVAYRLGQALLELRERAGLAGQAYRGRA